MLTSPALDVVYPREQQRFFKKVKPSMLPLLEGPKSLGKIWWLWNETFCGVIERALERVLALLLCSQQKG